MKDQTGVRNAGSATAFGVREVVAGTLTEKDVGKQIAVLWSKAFSYTGKLATVEALVLDGLPLVQIGIEGLRSAAEGDVPSREGIHTLLMSVWDVVLLLDLPEDAPTG